MIAISRSKLQAVVLRLSGMASTSSHRLLSCGDPVVPAWPLTDTLTLNAVPGVPVTLTP